MEEKDKILLSEVLPVIGELLEEELDLLEREDDLEQIKVLHEENEGLESEAAVIHILEGVIMFAWLDVTVDVEVVDLL